MRWSTCAHTESHARHVRAGFTLIELMIALALTGIAAAIASSAVGAARRTEAVVQDHRVHAEADLRLRAMLQDMLRHAPPASMVDAPLVEISGAPDARVLTFLSRGVVAPFGTGRVWRVTVRQASDSLLVDAVTVSANETAPIHTSVPGVTSLSVRVLERATQLDGMRWREDWPVARARPAAIALAWSARGGEPVPLIVAMDALQAGAP